MPEEHTDTTAMVPAPVPANGWRSMWWIALALLASGSLAAQPNHTIASEEDFERAMEELSNWGRWGDEDELGAKVESGDDAGLQRSVALKPRDAPQPRPR